MTNQDDVARDLVQRAHAEEVRPDFDVEAGVSDVFARAEALQLAAPGPMISQAAASGARSPIEFEPGTPVAAAVTRGREEFTRADAAGSVRRPRVFLSFAGNDRVKAERLRQDLGERDIETFAFPPGGNFVLDINRAVTQSDYFVLLWSQVWVDHPWADAEWSAALARQLQEQRSFLFIVRLDTTPLPPLLAPRQYLDAFNNWDELVNELSAIWIRDREVGDPVFPAPFLAATGNGEVQRPSIVLYVRNRALSVAHVIVVPTESTGQDLESLVRNALALPDVEEKFGGAVGMRFHYQLKNDDQTIPLDKTLVELNITDGATIELEVQVESFGPTGSSPIITYRQGASTDPSPAATRSLIDSAFLHLTPW
jgi:TIR domain